MTEVMLSVAAITLRATFPYALHFDAQFFFHQELNSPAAAQTTR